MFKRETVLVVGLGKSGLAAVKALRRQGAAVVATDEKSREDLQGVIAEIGALGARFEQERALDAALRDVTFAVVSPGVPPTSIVLRRVLGAGIPAIGEIELAYRLFGGYVVAVTGTKGKSTTTALIGHLLRASGRDVRVGGNIGEPLVEQIDGASADSWCVAEVSSFQLEGIVRFRPRIAVILNVSPDHLDRYRSMEEYAAAKFRIVENQDEGDTTVLDLDDPLLRSLWPRLEQKGVRVRAYTLQEPRDPRASMYVRGETICYAPTLGESIPLIERGEIPLTGEHNVRNAMAAFLAALAAGCEIAALQDAIRRFSGLPHRLQEVAEIGGVLYVDDSKATNPQATIAALRACTRPVVLVAGGRAKGTDFDALGAVMRERAKALVAIGEAGPAIAAAARPVPHETAHSMDDAVARARRLAKTGDVVLLSPACASFDMFASAEDRGEQFGEAVRALQETVHAR
jgi:UDP-N-acetylmuramoylalanine--D-glutamate ligase